MDAKDSAKGEEPLNEEPSGGLPRRVRLGDMANLHSIEMERVEPGPAAARLLKGMAEVDERVEEEFNESLPPRLQNDAAVTRATQEMGFERTKLRARHLEEDVGKKVKRLEGPIRIVNPKDGTVKEIDPNVQRGLKEFWCPKYGRGYNGIVNRYESLVKANQNVRTDKVFWERLYGLADGQQVQIDLGEGRSETVKFEWPEWMMSPERREERVGILLAMWESRGALLEAIDARQRQILHQVNPDRYVFILQEYQAGNGRAPEYLQVFINDVATDPELQRTQPALQNEFNQLVRNQTVVGEYVTNFGPGILFRDLKTLEGTQVSVEEIQQIVKALRKLPPEAREMIGDITWGMPALLPALLLSLTLQWKNGSVLGDIREWKVRLTRERGHTAMYVKIPKGKEERVDFAYKNLAAALDTALVRGTNDRFAGEINYFNDRIGKETLNQFVKAITHSDLSLTDTKIVKEKVLGRWAEALAIIRQGRRGAPDDEPALRRLGVLTASGGLRSQALYDLGAILELCHARGYRPSFDDLASYMHSRWDTGSHRAYVPFERLPETHDTSGESPLATLA